ncbi:hypothetical protein SS50377_25776 [Spironucleus salmonicida]|uniref:Uncharacterized protein n=1 Tax=Spironucleus salmonicida TaxID=348837 RepID=V6LVI5_9EUKA|nr:hypothetical protein SS50377_25776 [Spironucleus salmonicida]|eukprot:EST48248.1 Hypothetical protein SS50377_11589 [Spironucleus salmonicida]
MNRIDPFQLSNLDYDFRNNLQLTDEQQELLLQILLLIDQQSINFQSHQLIKILQILFPYPKNHNLVLVFLQSINSQANYHLFYNLLCLPQYLMEYIEHDDCISSQGQIFCYFLHQKLYQYKNNINNAYSPRLTFSIHNFNLAQKIWRLENCTSELSFYFQCRCMSQIFSWSFEESVKFYEVARIQKEICSKYYCSVQQFLNTKFDYNLTSLNKLANLYENVINYDLQVRRYPFYLNEQLNEVIAEFLEYFCSDHKIQVFMSPTKQILHDFRYVSLNDMISIIPSAEFSILNILFRVQTKEDLIDNMIKQKKLYQFILLLKQICFPFDSQILDDVFLDQIICLQQQQDLQNQTKFILPNLTIQYQFFKNILEIEEQPDYLCKLKLLILNFSIQIPALKQLENDVDDMSQIQLITASYYINQKQLSHYQKQDTIQDKIVLTVIQQVEQNSYLIEKDWKKWSNLYIDDLIQQFKLFNIQEKSYQIQRLFQLTFKKILSIFKLSSVSSSQYKQTLIQLQQQVRLYKKEFGHRYALFYICQYLAANPNQLTFILQLSLNNPKIYKLLLKRTQKLNKQVIMNLSLRIDKEQHEFFDQYLLDIYYQSVNYYRTLTHSEFLMHLKNIQNVYKKEEQFNRLLLLLSARLPDTIQQDTIIKPIIEKQISLLFNDNYFKMIFPEFHDQIQHFYAPQDTFQHFYFHYLQKFYDIIKSDLQFILNTNQQQFIKFQSFHCPTDSNLNSTQNSYDRNSQVNISAFNSVCFSNESLNSSSTE